MQVPKDFLNRLKDFGLNSYESKLWVALLSRGVSTAGELSDISNVPRSRAYDVLESLEKKGFILMKVGKPIKYMAVPPAEVIERVKKHMLEEAEEKTHILSKLHGSDVLGELSTLHSTGVKIMDPTDKSGAFRGQDKALEHLSFLFKSAKKSVVLMTTAAGLERKYDALGGFLRRASKSGVDVRVAVPTSANKDVVESLGKFAKVKQVKEHNGARFCIVDGKEMLLFLTDDKTAHQSYDCAVWVEAPQFVEYFGSLFEKEWKGTR